MQSFYPAVEERQGDRNTCYAGEIMAYSTVETTCEYSRALVERFF